MRGRRIRRETVAALHSPKFTSPLREFFVLYSLRVYCSCVFSCLLSIVTTFRVVFASRLLLRKVISESLLMLVIRDRLSITRILVLVLLAIETARTRCKCSKLILHASGSETRVHFILRLYVLAKFRTFCRNSRTLVTTL